MRHPPPYLCFVVLLLLFGCSGRPLLPVPPNVLRDGSGTAQLNELPETLHRPEMHILYVTDRQKLPGDQRGDRFGYGRSTTVRYGESVVSLGDGATWDAVTQDSGSSRPSRRYPMRITQVRELGSFLPLTSRLRQDSDGTLALDEEALRAESDAAQAALRNALLQTPHKDVYLYIHGFGNTFDNAVLRTAGMWHYLGRRGVAVAYTWPAGHGGMLGYFYDRESGEFTIYHLKRTLRVIAGCPEVQRVHVIAHSRGTDIALTALRELNGELRGAGVDPREALKLKTVVLAAPDVDLDVFGQRFGSENMVAMADRFVIYTATDDIAMAAARLLFGGRGRLGGLDPYKSDPELMQKISLLPGLEFIRTDVKGYSSSHAYVFSHPAALSDLVLVLRDRRDPGESNGRPLQRHVGWWLLDDAYLAEGR